MKITRNGNIVQYDADHIPPEKAIAIAEEFEVKTASTFPKGYGDGRGVLYFESSARAYELVEVFKAHFGVKEEA